MSNDVLGYSSHDWRKHTDDAIVVASNIGIQLEVNKSKVIFTNPKSLKKEEVDVSRLIRVFVNNYESHKRSVK
mgnify:CR=1 FL=1|jgi:hypothetical protein|tara:strand:+ start:44 stop:262 length:219 start_codon:yes stop_codon:yes gene_type:complete